VFRNVTLECWGVLVPVTAALTAALSVRADHESWRLLLSYAVPRWRFFVGKFCGLATLGFVSSTVLLVMISGGAALNGQLGHDFWAIVASAYLPWLAGLAMTALALLVAVMWGLGPAIAIGVIGMLSGALVSDKTFWYAIPFAWPMRVILPLAGIGPNGIPLPPGSPLADAGVIPFALVLSAGLAAVLMVLGGVHLTRKEI
jgi:ABC-2 type transport system permease protein